MHSLIIPEGWSLPRFSFNQQVKLKHNNGVGVIVGLQYGRSGDAIGWYYELELEPDSPAWQADWIECAHETELEAVASKEGL